MIARDMKRSIPARPSGGIGPLPHFGSGVITMRISFIVTSGLAAVALLPLSPLLAQTPAADLARGKAQYARCQTCHAITAGAPKRIGPNLFGIVGKAAGKQPGFRYSPAMSASGITWTPAKLDAYIAKPRDVVPGTSMVFAGMPDAAARKALVAYIAAAK